jgi:DNA-binding CsgD family transcriptional regulator
VASTTDLPCDLVRLTEREAQVLAAIAASSTSHEAASALGVSRRTVDTHIAAMLRKAGLRNRTELLALAVANGIIDMTATPPRWTGRTCLPRPAGPGEPTVRL